MTEQASWLAANTDEAPEYNGNSILPEGQYPFFIEKVELKQGGESGKKYINLWLKIRYGPLDGRMVFFPIFASSSYLNHSNQDWVQQQFNALKRVFMVTNTPLPDHLPTPTDLQLLGGKELDAKIGHEYDDKKGEDKEKVLDTFPFTPDTSSPPVQQGNSGIPVDEFDDDIPFN